MLPSPSSSAPPKRACDACHRRKVKCIPDPGAAASSGSGPRPCKNCKSSGLACTYDSVPQKKGPKGSRAKVISELRDHQRRNSLSSTLRSSVSPPTSPVNSRTSTALPFELIQACLDFFFENVYPTQPILDRAVMQEQVRKMAHNPESYCLVVSLCAFMLIQPNMQLPESLIIDIGDSEMASTTPLGITLLSEVLERRKSINYIENPTASCVRTSFFLFGCYFCMEKHNTAYFHLREATTLALLLGMHQERMYQTCDPTEARFKRRLFWLLYVTERAYALQAQRPLTLHDTIKLPEVTDETGDDAEKLMGFIHLIVLFKPFDDTFVGLWNQSIENGTTVDWISTLQKQLAEALPVYLRSTEAQAVDLKTSQQWLRVMIWQLSISQKLLSSTATDESLTFRYPLQLAHQLASEASQFSQHNMEVHGIGLVKKLFDVACTLVDVMGCVPIEPHSFEVGPRDHLNHFVNLMSKLRGGHPRYLPLLLTKINETIPGLQTHGIPMALPSSFNTQFQESVRQGDGGLGGGLGGLGAGLAGGLGGIGGGLGQQTIQGPQHFARTLPKEDYSEFVDTPNFGSDSAYGNTSGLDSPFSVQESSYPG